MTISGKVNYTKNRIETKYPEKNRRKKLMKANAKNIAREIWKTAENHDKMLNLETIAQHQWRKIMK